MIKQIFFSAVGEVEVRDAAPPPAPEGAEVLVSPAFVGICGTDLHVLHGRYRIKPPLVIGHEMAGVIDAVGPDVKQFAPGDHVTMHPVMHCGRCGPCLRGRFNICEQASVVGFHLPGAAQTKLLVQQSQLHKVPEGVSLRHAAFAEPLSVGVHAVTRANDLEDVLIIGGGTIGLCVLVAARAAGARRVTIIEPVQAKRELALHLGATDAVTPTEATPERHFTTCFDIVCNQATVRSAMTACASGGTIVMVGTAHGEPEFDLPRLQRYEITLRGSSIFMHADMQRALQLLQGGTFDPQAFVTHSRPLAEAVDAYAGAAKPDNVKTLIEMQEF